jgi:hypothetical protein
MIMAIALIFFIVVVAVGALLAGSDSRIDDVSRRRRYLG